MTQTGLLEHLKLENVSLSQQLTETQHRSIKEKERIALQLQGIEVSHGRGQALSGSVFGAVLCFFFFRPLVKNKKICKYICTQMYVNTNITHTFVCLLKYEPPAVVRCADSVPPVLTERSVVSPLL